MDQAIVTSAHLPHLLPTARAAALAALGRNGDPVALEELRALPYRRDPMARATNVALTRVAHSYCNDALRTGDSVGALDDDVTAILGVLAPWLPKQLHLAANLLRAADDGNPQAQHYVMSVQDAAESGDASAGSTLKKLRLAQQLRDGGAL